MLAAQETTETPFVSPGKAARFSLGATQTRHLTSSPLFLRMDLDGGLDFPWEECSGWGLRVDGEVVSSDSSSFRDAS